MLPHCVVSCCVTVVCCVSGTRRVYFLDLCVHLGILTGPRVQFDRASRRPSRHTASAAQSQVAQHPGLSWAGLVLARAPWARARRLPNQSAVIFEAMKPALPSRAGWARSHLLGHVGLPRETRGFDLGLEALGHEGLQCRPAAQRQRRHGTLHVAARAAAAERQTRRDGSAVAVNWRGGG